jgi:Tol biopolymer transport system component
MKPREEPSRHRRTIRWLAVLAVSMTLCVSTSAQGPAPRHSAPARTLSAQAHLSLPLVIKDAVLQPTPEGLPTPPLLPTPDPTPDPGEPNRLAPAGGSLTLVSVDDHGQPANSDCLTPALSADGRYVAFVSTATNLVTATGAAATTEAYPRLYHVDLHTGAWRGVPEQMTALALLEQGAIDEGRLANIGAVGRIALSGDGQLVAFDTMATLLPKDRNHAPDVYLWRIGKQDLWRGGLTPFYADLTYGAERPALSADGALLAFDSASPELMPGSSTMDRREVFVQDLITGAIVRVSVDVIGPNMRPALSADGRYITFQTVADNPAMGDRNGMDDIYVYDGFLGRTSRISQARDGGDSDGPSWAPTLSADGRYIVHVSAATNIVPDAGLGASSSVPTSHILIRRWAQSDSPTERISVTPSGLPASGPNEGPSVSADGRYVVFSSVATNLVSGATGGHAQIFLRDRVSGSTVCLSQSPDGYAANGPNYWPTVSADGHTVVFMSEAANLTPEAGSVDVFGKQIMVWRRHF